MIFDQITANKEKQEQKEIQKRISRLEGFASIALEGLKHHELTLEEVAFVLKAASDKLNKLGRDVKFDSV